MFSSLPSRFKPNTYFVAIMFFLVPIAYGLAATFYFIPSGLLKNSTIQYVFAGTIGILNPVIGFFLMRKRLYKLEFSDYGIKGRAFLGFGKEKEWVFSELEGYSVNVSDGKNGKLTETVKFLQSGKSELEISDAIYSNFEELKAAFAAKLKEIKN